MKAENKKSIEEYIEDLNKIADRLNRSDIPLDEAVNLYKQGMEVAAGAQEMLKHYEQEIEILNDTANESGKKSDG